MNGGCVVDASCLINCVAGDNVRALIIASKMMWHVPSAVQNEALFVRGIDGEGRSARIPIDLRGLVQAGLLAPCEPVGVEIGTYLGLARKLDDGEAMGISIARHRNWLLATDDRKARRLCVQLGVRVLATPQIVRHWVQVTKPDQAEVTTVIDNIERLARFIPSLDLPDSKWWNAQRSDER